MSDGLDRVRAALGAREAAGLRRTLRPRAQGEAVLDLASNDYLGLSGDPRVVAAAGAAAAEWGAGSTGSRLVTGTTALHAELEAELAEFCRAPSALVFSSGYLANVGVLTALGGPDVTIVSDAANHASLIDGCRLAHSPVTVVGHRDVAAVAAALDGARTTHRIVVTDAVFSVDGDLAPLRELHDLARAHGALLVVDEAHALGVIGEVGRGAVEAAGLAGEPDVVRTAVLSKSLGSQGGAVLAAPEIVELLVSTARSFIFDTGLAPAAASAALAALRVLRDEPERPAAVRRIAAELAAAVRALGVETVEPAAAVVPAVLGDPRQAVAAAAACLEAGVRVGCFRPPSVPAGRACLRLTARAVLTAADLDRVRDVLATVLAPALSGPALSGPARAGAAAQGAGVPADAVPPWTVPPWTVPPWTVPPWTVPAQPLLCSPEASICSPAVSRGSAHIEESRTGSAHQEGASAHTERAEQRSVKAPWAGPSEPAAVPGASPGPGPVPEPGPGPESGPEWPGERRP